MKVILFTGGIAQGIECLTSKHEILNLKPQYHQKKKSQMNLK
jgi:hypothetical protein